MKNTIQVGVLLLAGAAGALLHYGYEQSGSTGRSSSRAAATGATDTRRVLVEDTSRIDALLAEIERLKALLEANEKEETPDPYADDTPEAVEKLLEDAYAENNVDWLLEVIERLLRMGPRGYPILRRMLEDIIFKAKFLPSQSDFRPDQLYKLGKIFSGQERQFIGFLNYLLIDPRTNVYFKQGAMMGAAFYVGSQAPGSEELQQTLVQQFMAQGGGAGLAPSLMGNMGKKMNIFAMAMSGDKKMIEPLRDELRKTKDENLKGDIVGALAYLGDPKALPLIKDRLDPRQGDFRREIDALGRLDTEESHAAATDFLRAIPDSKRFYRHTSRYVRAGGGSAAVLLIKERVTSNPDDPEVRNAIGTLRRYPTRESVETLNLIRDTSKDDKVAKRAADAAADIDRRLRGEIPTLPNARPKK